MRLIALGKLHLAAAVAVMGTSMAAAHDYTVGDLFIDHPFARASAGMARAGAAYMTIQNNGAADDVLIGAEAAVSERIELHTHEMTDGVMRMREVEGGIPVPAGETTVLQPGGLHVMFLGLHEPLVEGEMFPLTLIFEQSGAVTVEVSIEGVAAGADGAGHSGHDH